MADFNTPTDSTAPQGNLPQAGIPGNSILPTQNDGSSASTPDPTSAAQPSATQPSSAPSGPARAPASAVADSSGPHGVLASIAVGALRGLTEHVAKNKPQTSASGPAGILSGAGRKVGGLFAEFARNSDRGQQLQNNAIQRQAEQQNMKLQSQKAAEDSQHAMDEHQAALLQHNILSMTQVHTAFMNSADEAIKSKEINDANQAFFDQLKAAGIEPQFESMSHGDLTQSHAQGIVNGEYSPLAHGESGENAGLHLYSSTELKGQALAKDVTVPTDYHIDEKTGELKPEGHVTMPAGADAYQAWQLYTSEQAKGVKEKTEYDQAQARQKTKADIANINSEAGSRKTPGQVSAESKADVSKSQAETAEAQARAKLVNEQATNELTNQTPNVFGETNESDLNQKDVKSRWKDFNQKVLVPLQTSTDKSYKMATAAYDEYQKAGGKLPTGAQSMLMLSQHLATTFGNVKGSRVTKDMIQEHLGARGVSDTALTAIQRLTNGDQLSPDQWQAFNYLIGQSREVAYESAIDNARSNGIGKSIPSFLPRAASQGQKIDTNTAKIYLYAAQGDPKKAAAAAQQSGWSF